MRPKFERLAKPARGRALAVQWIVCGAVLVVFAELLSARAGISNTLRGGLHVVALLNVAMGALTWRQANKDISK